MVLNAQNEIVTGASQAPVILALGPQVMPVLQPCVCPQAKSFKIW